MKTLCTILFLVIFLQTGRAQIGVQALSKTSSSQFIAAFSIGKIYPNPVKDLVNVEFMSDDPGIMQISLINILGREVKKWEPHTVVSGTQKIKLDLSVYQTGIYFLKFIKSDKVITQVIKKN